MNNKYYYPISSTSLATVFGQACILPACLYNNRLADIQSKYDKFILLTEKFGCSGSDCCVEVNLTQNEVESLVDIKGGFFFLKKALPISRVRKIYFANKAQALRTITTINLSTAYIPMSLVSQNDNCFEESNIKDIVIPPQLVDSIEVVKSSYDNYNRILGALALMKVAHKEGCNASPLYVDTVAKFNALIKSQKNKVLAVNPKFHSFFDKPDPLVKSIVDGSLLEEIARKHNQTINKKKYAKVIDPSNLSDKVYLCYVLNNYAVGEESRRDKIDELILNNFTGLHPGTEESCAFYYGYNRGYSVFNNEYRGENKTEVVKYKLDNLLDYYIIESVFEYTFNKTIPSSLLIIDSWFKPSCEAKAKRGEYVIMNTVIRDKKKVPIFSEEWWTECLHSFLPKDSRTVLGQDFTPIIIQNILKPFADFIKDEIEDEYNNKIDSIGESSNTTINDFSCKHEKSQLRSELETSLSKTVLDKTAQNTADVTTPKKDDITTTIGNQSTEVSESEKNDVDKVRITKVRKRT